MKRSLFLIIVGCLSQCVVFATVHVVEVSNFQFSPATMTVFVGDTVRFIRISGFHTTSCSPGAVPNTSLPAGAATWDAPMANAGQTFDYPVTTPGVYNYLCQPHASFMTGTFTAQVSLPLKFSSFSVETKNGSPYLTWKTMAEQNTDRFSVKRSTDGSSFTEVASLPAAGNSSTEKLYAFADVKTGSQRFYYYNITTIDKDGKQQVSDTKLYKNTHAENVVVLTLSPNPIASPGHLSMTFNAEKESKMNVRIISADGKTIVNRDMQAYAGVNKGHIHLGELAAGTYTLICTLDGITESHQIIYR